MQKWLGGVVPLAQFNRHDGMPTTLIAQAAHDVAQWSMSLLSLPDFRNDTALHAARTQALTLQKIAEDWHGPVMLPRHLRTRPR